MSTRNTIKVCLALTIASLILWVGLVLYIIVTS